MKVKKYLGLLGLILICQAVGGAGAFFTVQSINEWYVNLAKPFFNPPNWIFGPMWTLLYLMMAISCWLVLIEKNKAELKVQAIIFFIAQLGVNSIWSFLFFGLRNPFLGLIDILLLCVLIYMTLRIFQRISKKAFYLLLPYFAWVLFATLLNFSLWWMNRG